MGIITIWWQVSIHEIQFWHLLTQKWQVLTISWFGDNPHYEKQTNWTSERDWPSQLCIYSIVNRHTYISHLELKIKLFSLWHVFAQNSFFSFMNIYFYIFILIVVILHIFTYNLEKLWFPVILSKFVKNHYSYL